MPDVCSILVKAQPSGKDGRHVCTVKFPDMYKGGQLAKFAKTLQQKVGQENFSEEELIGDDAKEVAQEAAPQSVIELPVSTLARQQEFLAETELFTLEMQALIVSNIFDKKGTGWIVKKDLFKLSDSFDLNFPSNKLIGRLLRLGYLENDKDNPGKRSRLTQQACMLIGKLEQLPTTASAVIKEEDLEILIKLDALKEAAGLYTSLSKELCDVLNDKKRISDATAQLKEKLESITLLANKKIEENEGIIFEKNAQAEAVANSITPRMIEASRRLELMFSDLPTE